MDLTITTPTPDNGGPQEHDWTDEITCPHCDYTHLDFELKLTDDEHERFREILIERLRIDLEAPFAIDSTIRRQRGYVSASAEHRSLALYRALNLGELGD